MCYFRAVGIIWMRYGTISVATFHHSVKMFLKEVKELLETNIFFRTAASDFYFLLVSQAKGDMPTWRRGSGGQDSFQASESVTHLMLWREKKWTTWLALFFRLGNTACQLVEPRRTEVFVCPRGEMRVSWVWHLCLWCCSWMRQAPTHRFKYVGWRRVLTLFNSVSPCSHSSGSWRSCKLCCVCICTSHLGDSPRGAKCPRKVNNELELYLEKHYGL